MKQIERMLSFGWVLLTLFATSAYAESPQEQLNQMVQQLLQTPNDNALREKIIKLTGSIKPAPAVPEEGRRHFVKAVTLQKDAKNSADYGLAISEYQQALLIAPWWSDAYYNLSVAYEASGQFNDAMSTLKLYLMTNLSEADARTAQDKLYVLEAKQEEVAKEKADKDAAAREEEAKYGWLLGRWREQRIQHLVSSYSNNYYENDGTYQASKEGNMVIFTSIGEYTSQYPDGSKHTKTMAAGIPASWRASLTKSGQTEWEYNWGTLVPRCGYHGWQRSSPTISSDRRMISFTLSTIGAAEHGGCENTGEFKWVLTRE